MAHVFVVAHFYLKPDKQKEFIEAARPMVEGTRKEEGCIFYDLHQDLEKPNEFWMLEEWVSLETLNVHSQAPHVSAAKEEFKKRDSLEKPTEVHKMNKKL